MPSTCIGPHYIFVNPHLAVLYCSTWLKQCFNPTDAELSMVEEPRNPTPVITRSLLMRDSPGDGAEDGVREGVKSFFHSGKNLDGYCSSTRRPDVVLAHFGRILTHFVRRYFCK